MHAQIATIRYNTDLLFYEAATGTGEFYATFYMTDGGFECTRLRTHTGWRTSWTHIIPGRFAGKWQVVDGRSIWIGFTDLLFYDSAGTGEFWTTDGQGGIRLLRTHTGWVSPAGVPWTHIIPGQFGGSTFTDLLFYDSAGTGAFYTTDGQGGIHPLRTHTGWVSPAGVPWTHIIPGQFGGSTFSDLLFYDSAGTGAFYTTDGQGGIHLLKTHSGWVSPAGTPWTHLVPGQFEYNSPFTDVLFYEAASGTGAFWKVDGQGGISSLRTYTDWPKSAQIIPGEFGNTGLTDLLFYDAAAGSGAFHLAIGNGTIGGARRYTGWRRTWTRIIPGRFKEKKVPYFPEVEP